MNAMDKVTAIAEQFKLQAQPGLVDALMAAYTDGRVDGAMAAAQAMASRGAQAGSGGAVDPRRAQQSADLALVADRHPEVDLQKPVLIGRTPYKIIGFKAGAPKHAFLIEGPQGGRYKCPVETILKGQR